MDFNCLSSRAQWFLGRGNFEVPRTIAPYTCCLPRQIGLHFNEVEFSRRHAYVITFPVQNLNQPDIFPKTPLRPNPLSPRRTPPPLSASFGTYVRPPLTQLALRGNHASRVMISGRRRYVVLDASNGGLAASLDSSDPARPPSPTKKTTGTKSWKTTAKEKTGTKKWFAWRYAVLCYIRIN